MFISELFVEEEEVVDTPRTYLPKMNPRFNQVIQRLAKFHRMPIEFDPNAKQWYTAEVSDDNPFIRDVMHVTSANNPKAYESKGQVNEEKLVAIFRKETPNVDKAWVWKTGSGLTDFEVEDTEHGRYPIGEVVPEITSAKTPQDVKQLIRKAMFKLNFHEGCDVTVDSSFLGEASMTKSIPPKKESQFTPAMQNIVDNNRKGARVAVLVPEYPYMVGFGNFIRVGESGLVHVKLSKELAGWAAGDVVAVWPSELRDPENEKYLPDNSFKKKGQGELTEAPEQAFPTDTLVDPGLAALANKYVARMLDKKQMGRSAVVYTANALHSQHVSLPMAMLAARLAYFRLSGKDITEEIEEGEESSPGNEEFQVGQPVTFYYSKYHPNLKAVIVKIYGNFIDVKSQDSGDVFKLHREAVKSVL